ncbi:MAG: TerB family tellurite resistance protein [Polyangiaceae bacterium]|nr:TerB family tellurite resistance protein [Polyangiaceae bacterium]
MSSAPKLGRDIFVALAAVGWADGHLDPEEADAIVRTAVEAGLELDEIAEIEEATQTRVDLGEIDRRELSKEDRLFVYAVASWMTWLDGEVSEEETAALARLGDSLKIPEKPRQHADAIMREVAYQSEDIRPARYDLSALRSLIHERLEEAQRARAEIAPEE